MNNELLKQFYRLGLTENEVENILTIAPEIGTLSVESFKKNCEILVKFGYPKIDLDALLLANPNIFTHSQNELTSLLEDLLSETGDIEEALKTNPFII